MSSDDDHKPPPLDYASPREDVELGETWGEFFKALSVVLFVLVTMAALYILVAVGLSRIF